MTPPPPTPSNTRYKWVLLGFLAIAGYFLITEHAAHVAGALPWLLLLACPLMHLFMHRGHGGHGGGHGHEDGARRTPRPPTGENPS